MNNTEKAVTWGLLALIAWELWKPMRDETGAGSGVASVYGDNIPEWVKQLSRRNNKIDYFTRRRGMWGGC